MNTFEVKIPEYYIASKPNGKEQIVKYFHKGKDAGEKTQYHGYYGINGYHEVITLKKNMRELTNEERELFSKKKYWSLPQEFYHSFPNY